MDLYIKGTIEQAIKAAQAHGIKIEATQCRALAPIGESESNTVHAQGARLSLVDYPGAMDSRLKVALSSWLAEPGKGKDGGVPYAPGALLWYRESEVVAS